MPIEQRIREALARDDVDGATTELMRGYGSQILGYLRTVLRDPEDAAEVFSQFAEDAWKGLRGFRGDATARVWAYKVAWHAASRFSRDPYRRRMDRLGTTMASRLAEELISSAGSSYERRTAEVERIRQRITEEEQSLLTLRVDRRLSWREVAEVMAADGEEVDEQTLRKRFERLKAKLARELARARGGDG